MSDDSQKEKAKTTNKTKLKVLKNDNANKKYSDDPQIKTRKTSEQ